MNLATITEDFQYLETVTEKPPDCFMERMLKYPKATSFHNSPKNRYHNVLPLESSRVKLSPLEHIPDSDYINANFVNYEDSRYICCQAPLPNTIGDFWRMIWEQEASIIVMLTELVSLDGQVKAHSYWPTTSQLSLTFGSLMVSLVSEESDGPFTIRLFLLTANQVDSLETRHIYQIHYSGWPDFSPPTRDFKELLIATEKYKDKTPKADGTKKPIVVHCSAGVGRTGVFVAGRTCVKLLKQHKPVNVLQIVKYLRSQRTGLVQTLHQYQFLHSLVASCQPRRRSRSVTLTACHSNAKNSAVRFEPLPPPSLIV